MSSNVVNYDQDRDYASSRLRNTVVRRKCDGSPVYVEGVTNSGLCTIKDIGIMSHWEEIDISDLDLEPMPLGYVNTNQTASYVHRRPTRHYKQGLNETNFKFVGKGLSGVGPFSSPIRKTILGKYPSVSDCYEMIVCGEAEGQAFCRDFALSKTKTGAINLNYRSQTVVGRADMTEAGITLTLKPEYDYLSESLEESCK